MHKNTVCAKTIQKRADFIDSFTMD